MSKVIIHKGEEGGVVIINPAPSFTAEECIVDVPPNTPYKIVDISEVPEDREFRDAWEYQE